MAKRDMFGSGSDLFGSGESPTVTRMVAIIRVSRISGREGDEFLSPRKQREAIEEWARRRGIEILEFIEELDESGSTTDREGLKKAMSMILTGKADGLVVARLDRLARNVIDGLKVIQSLTDAGKVFVSVRENIDQTDASNFVAKLFLHLMFIFAEWQWWILKEYWEENRQDAVDRGIATAVPYGYSRPPSPKKLKRKLTDQERQTVVVPEEAKVVVRIFKRRAAGDSWHDIADQLNKEGIPGPSGGRWYYQTVRFIAKNRFYLGELRHDRMKKIKDPVTGEVTKLPHPEGPIVKKHAHPAIIDLSLFLQVEATMGIPRLTHDTKNPSPLRGILRCGTCGGRMIAASGGRTRKVYRCQGKFIYGTCPNPALIYRDMVEPYIMESIIDDLKHSKMVPRKSKSDIEAARKARDVAEAELDEYLSSPTMARIREKYGQAKFDAGLAPIEDKLAAAEADLARLESGAIGIDLPANAAEVFRDLTLKEQQSLIGQLYPVIAVRGLDVPKQRGFTVEDRVVIWRRNDVGVPKDLPGRYGVKRLVRLADPICTGKAISETVSEKAAS